VQVPPGTGVQSATGLALTGDGVQESVRADEQSREDLGAAVARPRLAAKTAKPAAR